MNAKKNKLYLDSYAECTQDSFFFHADTMHFPISLPEC